MTSEPHLFRVRLSDWKRVWPLLLLLAIDAIVGQFAEVVATSGFLAEVGIAQLPWLWLISMAISLSATTVFALVVDQSRRVSLMQQVLGGFVLAYGLIALLMGLSAPEALVYPLLYVITEVQYVVFPLALWALAGDLFSLADARRLFPVIAAGAALGNILGNALAALLAVLLAPHGGGTWGSMATATLLYLLALLTLRSTLGRVSVRARSTAKNTLNLREDVQVWRDFFGHVPLFRNLALAIFWAGLGFTLLEFYFLRTVDRQFLGQPSDFQSFYGIYKILLYSLLWLVQGVISAELVRRIELKRSFVALPLTLGVALLGMLLFPVFAVVVVGQFVGRLVQWGWDHPSRSVLLNLVPDERRGRISSFVNSYLYAASTTVGSLMLLLFLAAQQLSLLSERLELSLALSLALGACAAALWFALRLRDSYEKSLLNWRLARSKRKSVLDGLEF